MASWSRSVSGAITARPAFRLGVLTDCPIGDVIPPRGCPDSLVAGLVGAADGVDRYFRMRWHQARHNRAVRHVRPKLVINFAQKFDFRLISREIKEVKT
jgi:hypothetical protein